MTERNKRSGKGVTRFSRRIDRARRVSRPATGPLEYYALWKPYNVLSQFKPASGSSAETLASFVQVNDVYPAGRLDRDSEGLLLLTNDGLFQHKLCDPKFMHWRTYLVQVERIPNDVALERLCAGVKIKDKQTAPCKVERLTIAPELPARTPPIRERKTVETAWLKLSLTEGRNRQVRRMTAAIGHPTLRLIRSAIHLGEESVITLSGLCPGELRPFTEDERSAVTRLKKRRAKNTRITGRDKG